MKVQGKVIVVTGAANGIGRELTSQLLAKGAHVAAVDVNEAALRQMAALAAAPKRLSLHVVNVADRAAVGRLPDDVLAHHGAVDGVINNAGIIQPFVRIHDLEYAAIERVINVNFYGTLYMTKAFLPYLLQRPEAHIVNIASMGGFLPVPGQGIYGASKAAVKLMTEALYAELLYTCVRVTVVFPGATATEIARNSNVSGTLTVNEQEMRSSFPMLTAQQAAEQIVRAMEQNRYQAFVGRDSAFMNLLYRLNPKGAVEFLTRQMAALLPPIEGKKAP